MDSQYLKLALLSNDSFGVFLAAKCKEDRRKKKLKFDFESYDAHQCKRDFRFEKDDIVRLRNALGFPDKLIAANGFKFSTLEGMCLLLRRLAYPNRLDDLKPIFGRDKCALSRIFNVMLDFIYDNFSHLLTTWDQWWLDIPSLKTYALAIRQKGAPLINCFGFIDGSIHRICRPGKHQREVYSGHKRVHCLKYQSVVVPNGLIANLYGPEPGRRHDSYMLKQSKIMEALDSHIGSEDLHLYGDCGYPLKRCLITPYMGAQLSPEKIEFNRSMSKIRVSVEWEFGDLYEQWAFLNYKQNQKLYLQPIGKYYIVSAILKNCKTCLYGNQTSIYFKCVPPTLEQYLQNYEYC